MKKVVYLSLLLLVAAGLSCNSQSKQNPVKASELTGNVEVYYFHMSTRCVTCKTVEAEARKNIEVLYPEQIKSGKISFTSLNLEEATGKTVGDRLGVNSQTLLIVKGDTKINITNEGFLYAVSQPVKFAEVIKSRIDPLMK